MKMPTSVSVVTAAVVRGGFAGLALAIGLQKYAHIDVQVYEAAEKFSQVGAGIVVGPNAQQATRLIDPASLRSLEEARQLHETPPDEDGLYIHT
ncbi:hypothetical protein DOTSEDRAFT_71005 [Dothistroma septosporum NZE10]|uniref:FAD-binding domain-containing protein n=1 Tax=Dothistroma septosporum (strain NZE10 / CBS 128990) TaxID=675120 RepID=N1PRW0_DOTSN|nr:hypothetical protein DOTSEDRAFT_71005 [Dothistroma septosporum NZE10]